MKEFVDGNVDKVMVLIVVIGFLTVDGSQWIYKCNFRYLDMTA